MNGLTPPKSRAMEWSPGPTSRPPREAPAPSDAFAGILDSHQARTATAEGPKKTEKADDAPKRDQSAVGTRQSAEKADDKPAQKPEAQDSDKTTDAPAADVKPPTVPTAVVVQVAPVKPEEKPPVAVKSEAAATVAAPATQAAAAPVDPKTQPQTQAQTPAQTQTHTEDAPVQQAPVDAAKVAADAAKPAEAAPAAPAAPQADSTPVTTGSPRVAQAPVEQQPQQQAKGGDQGQQPEQQQGQQAPLQEQPAQQQARSAAQGYGRNTSTEVPTTVQSGTPAAAPATSVASTQPAAARGDFAPATPVPLARAAENVEHVLQLASSRGVTHARIALTPESLGSIDVHLRHTADGVVARVVAHSHDAAQQLQQAASDLRRQLDSQGVNVLSLDIGQSSADDRSAAGAGASFGDAQGGGSGGRSAGDESADADAETTVNSTLRLPNGVLVDVLA